MNDQDIEQRVRTSLALVDRTRVSAFSELAAAVERVVERRRRHRQLALMLTAIAVIVAVVVPLAMRTSANRPGRTRVVTEPTPVSASTPIGSKAASATSTSVASATTPAAAQTGVWRVLPGDPRGTVYGSEVVWTGQEAIALGGRDDSNRLQTGGAAYDPVRNTWRRIAQAPNDGQRINPLVAWTGSVVLVIGGDNPDGSLLVSWASSYDPARDGWRTLASPPIGFVTSRSPWAWTGAALLVWPSDGGGSSMPITAMAYDPIADSWQALSLPPVERRQDASSVWTGTEWVVWGGRNGQTELSDGAAYLPETASWRLLATSPLAARHTRAVWTGSEMIVAAGASGPDGAPLALADGAAYNPRTDSWRLLANGPAHPGFAPIWTGHVLLSFFKRYEFTYDPATDIWTEGPANEQSGVSPTPVWTGKEALVLGGVDGIGGAAFIPAR